MALISKFNFDKNSKLLVARAMSVCSEALTATAFKSEILYGSHREQLGRELLTRRPELIGTLASLAETDAVQAIALAVEAFADLRNDDALLFVTSRAPKSQVVAWLQKAYVGRDPQEIFGLVDRASDPDTWALRYDAMTRLQDRGADLVALATEIEARHAGDH